MAKDPDLILVDVNGQTLGLIDAVRSGEGVAGRVDPETPMIVMSASADRLQGSGCSSGGATTSSRNHSAYASEKLSHAVYKAAEGRWRWRWHVGQHPRLEGRP